MPSHQTSSPSAQTVVEEVENPINSDWNSLVMQSRQFSHCKTRQVYVLN